MVCQRSLNEQSRGCDVDFTCILWAVKTLLMNQTVSCVHMNSELWLYIAFDLPIDTLLKSHGNVSAQPNWLLSEILCPYILSFCAVFFNGRPGFWGDLNELVTLQRYKIQEIPDFEWPTTLLVWLTYSQRGFITLERLTILQSKWKWDRLTD